MSETKLRGLRLVGLEEQEANGSSRCGICHAKAGGTGEGMSLAMLRSRHGHGA